MKGDAWFVVGVVRLVDVWEWWLVFEEEELGWGCWWDWGGEGVGEVEEEKAEVVLPGGDCGGGRWRWRLLGGIGGCGCGCGCGEGVWCFWRRW